MPDCMAGGEEVTCTSLRRHNDYVAISIRIKSGHRYSDLDILMILPSPVLHLNTTT